MQAFRPVALQNWQLEPEFRPTFEFGVETRYRIRSATEPLRLAESMITFPDARQTEEALKRYRALQPYLRRPFDSDREAMAVIHGAMNPRQSFRLPSRM